MMATKAASVKASLGRTWSIFFATHGNLTPVQIAAIPPILGGKQTLIISATASGKTEAAVVPLIERHFLRPQQADNRSGLGMVFICPTRALTRDLYERLREPMAALNISLGMKTGDTPGISFQSAPSILITTPESTDSLLTRAPRLFSQLRAVVLDEIHLFDVGPRGDHLRCLLRRIEHIREFHQQQHALTHIPLHKVALSATVPDPDGLARRYLTPQSNSSVVRETDEPQDSTATGTDTKESPSANEVTPYHIVSVPGQRELNAVIAPMADLSDLAVQLQMRAASPLMVRKSLVFCNARAEVEGIATYLRQRLTFHAAVFVHYSNLDAALRRDIESDFASATVAVCVCTSTLELGIDIGSIDDVVLVGPPPSLTSFLQRIGRGGRRTNETRVLCLARTALEEVRFHALIELTRGNQVSLSPPAYHFRASVLVQQIFSILKQSPTGAIRTADLQRVSPVSIPDKSILDIFRNLVRLDYLKAGRLGEWRPGPMLDELLDAHEIYSNIGLEPMAFQIVDAFTGRAVAQTSRIRSEGDRLLIGGRSLEVVWRDRNRIGVRTASHVETAEEVRFVTAPFALSLEMSQGIARYLGLAQGQVVLLREEQHSWLFHFWGAIYGELLTAILRAELYPEVSRHTRTATEDDVPPWPEATHELCIRLPAPLLQLPRLNPRTAYGQLRRLSQRFEPFLSLGKFHSLLPPGLAHEVTVAICDLDSFIAQYQAAEVVSPSPQLRDKLSRLL